MVTNDFVKMEVISPDGEVLCVEKLPYYMTIPQFKRNMAIKHGRVKQVRRVKEDK